MFKTIGNFVTNVKQIKSQSDLISMSSFTSKPHLTIRSSVCRTLIWDSCIFDLYNLCQNGSSTSVGNLTTVHFTSVNKHRVRNSFHYSLLLGQFKVSLFYCRKGCQNDFALNDTLYPCESSCKNYLAWRSLPWGDFHSKVIGMLVVFLGYKILILVFFRVFWKIFGKWKPFFPKQPSKQPSKL